VLALLQGLGDLAHLRWDELRGLLRSREWPRRSASATRWRSLPELAALIRRLGRAERAARPQALPPQPLDAPRAAAGPRWSRRGCPACRASCAASAFPTASRGMLGSEAVHAAATRCCTSCGARAGRGRLLTYDSEAVLHDLRPTPLAPPRQDVAPPQPEALERGPIIVCLDTSGSMRGAPETIAKAVVLEALRTAHAEKPRLPADGLRRPRRSDRARAGGHGRDGLQALLDLMGQGFDGGTDVQAPIERAIERVHQARWASADLLIVSDGEFGCVPATLDAAGRRARALGLRVQGVLVGDRETMGLMEVADDIHWVRDWRRHGRPPGAAPASARCTARA
jgi:uncharacterized protein with von Willebrand factor type A (vWA) domain